jgi:peptide deformylase
MYEEVHIVHYPDPVLREKCTGFRDGDLAEPDKREALAALVKRMGQVLLEERGVGLAAPQVGVPRRLFVINLTGEPGQEKAYINPQFESLAGQEPGEEGCLSIPDVRVQVRRATDVVLRAVALDGEPFEEKAEGLLARAFQHEIDHLNGRLILDYMSEEEKLVNRRAIQDLQVAYEKTHPKPKKKSGARKGAPPRKRRTARR